MTSAKTEAFGADVVNAANFAKALSHPARIEILRVLAKKKTCVCGEVVDELPLAQSTVSQHLKALKEAGLIKGIVDGPAVCYCLDPKGFDVNREGFLALLSTITVESQCC